ncbi:MAG: toll/interleukin-1 receptor domain-containing protein [Bacteroidaceae bacterium]|nr:toll/interleukin-1 receptor domain-containing protein [Bacteroidaceae bacterium]
MEKKNKRIFISYKRVDKERVDALRKDIEQATGETCWIDRDGIESDAQFVSVIMKAIDQCEVFLFMRSKEHNNITNHSTDWTIREINYALAKRKRIVFISLDNAPLSDWFKFMFPQKEETDASDATKLEHLYADLRSWLNIPEKKEEAEEKPNTPIKTTDPLVIRFITNELRAFHESAAQRHWFVNTLLILQHSISAVSIFFILLFSLFLSNEKNTVALSIFSFLLAYSILGYAATYRSLKNYKDGVIVLFVSFFPNLLILLFKKNGKNLWTISKPIEKALKKNVFSIVALALILFLVLTGIWFR